MARPPTSSMGNVDMATYPGGSQIDQAQAVLDEHAVSSGDGMCVTCKVVGPCSDHEAAARIFMLSARLPRRQPGATHPELMGAKRVGGNWLLAGHNHG